MVSSEDLLWDKSAIVTGARRGIGKGIALELAKAGAHVVVCDNFIEDGKLKEVAEEIKRLKRTSLAIKLDVTKKVDIDNMVKRVMTRFSKIDILVNCAGICLPGESLLECDEKSWNTVIDTNLTGTFLCSQVIAKNMIVRKQGSIINIASEVGIAPIRDVGSYCVSKAGTNIFTQQLAMELGKYNIRVNSVAPGMVPTDINAPLWDTPEKAKVIADSLVLGRLGKPSDIGDAVVFLASDKASFITGQILVVNGGGTIVASRV
jgi:NAD(P)-dependent dehydrogenase (short-subunit alcohol dehydrogenase family)